LKERDYCIELFVDGRIMLKFVLNINGIMLILFMWFKI